MRQLFRGESVECFEGMLKSAVRAHRNDYSRTSSSIMHPHAHWASVAEDETRMLGLMMGSVYSDLANITMMVLGPETPPETLELLLRQAQKQVLCDERPELIIWIPEHQHEQQAKFRDLGFLLTGEGTHDDTDFYYFSFCNNPIKVEQLNDLRRHFLQITGVRWKIVDVMGEVIPAADVELTDCFYMQSCKSFQHPEVVNTVLCDFFEQDTLQETLVDLETHSDPEPRPISFPLAWVRQFHLAKRDPNLSEATIVAPEIN